MNTGNMNHQTHKTKIIDVQHNKYERLDFRITTPMDQTQSNGNLGAEKITEVYNSARKRTIVLSRTERKLKRLTRGDQRERAIHFYDDDDDDY